MKKKMILAGFLLGGIGLFSFNTISNEKPTEKAMGCFGYYYMRPCGQTQLICKWAAGGGQYFVHKSCYNNKTNTGCAMQTPILPCDPTE